MITDSECFFGALTKAAYTIEKRLIINTQTAKHAYRSLEITNVALVKLEKNIADALAKSESSSIIIDSI